MDTLLADEWRALLKNNNLKEISAELSKYDEYYPPREKIFAAINACTYNKIKVIIVGQDPYISEGEAEGYAFYTSTLKSPPSLKNIYKELQEEYPSSTMNMQEWPQEGVLLLNTILTVSPKISLSHENIGWKVFTKKVIDTVLKHNDFVVILAFGGMARDFVKNYKNVLYAGHPSPINTSNPFVGSNIFKECNDLLMKNNIKPIRWVKY
jgi:uracil-DNA glycosylase